MLDIGESVAVVLPQLLKGAAVTLKITALAAVLALVLSFLVAAARAAPWTPLRLLTVAYVEVFRGTSAIVQLFYLFFILPSFGVSLSPTTTAVVGLAMNFSAFGSEVVRSGLEAVARGQHEAAAALGMSKLQAYFLVVLPQAFVIMLPSFGNMLIDLIKASSLVSLITITELTFAGRQMVVTTGMPFTVWGLVLLIYFAMAYPLTWVVRMLEKRAARFRGSPA
ncbi:ectoine/hydroxyectoine ABC transporter permease subunit EhuC [Rhodoligotrophos defluvii]|uniref:ectoine/hydroxyectoine ABC transporter permease subunit EhuC n=1 Tax=Rhodoligotrophos defluvii TaxID=2561934 RepID=UPI0014856EDA|nr:ectoine/hydroxyectoine ABC transporter permease subunit EhuC [Rhodoligotrophos defluvii]